MSLRNALKELQELEASITLPAAVVSDLKLKGHTSVARAYLIAPDGGKGLPDLPCFINYPDELRDELRMGNFCEKNVSVQVDFYGPRNFDDVTQELVVAYWDATLAALRSQQPADQRLGGTVDYLSVRAERPMVATMEWNGIGYPGFRMYVDLQIFETVVPV